MGRRATDAQLRAHLERCKKPHEHDDMVGHVSWWSDEDVAAYVAMWKAETGNPPPAEGLFPAN